ncbi:MAG: TetR/AcrR family transcriptional regulator [Pseudomonadota bacterium]
MTNTDRKLWVTPTQERSRIKVQRILDAALDLAAKQGSLELRMTDIAVTAEVSVGTLYQFFPSRTAVVGALFAREMTPIDNSIDQLFDGESTDQPLTEQIEKLILSHLKLAKRHPGLAVLWAASAVDPAVEAADLANTHKNAGRLASHLSRSVSDQVDEQDLYATALLLCHLWSSVVRLCLRSKPADAKRIVRQYAALIAARESELKKL